MSTLKVFDERIYMRTEGGDIYVALKKEKGHFQVNESILATISIKHPEYINTTQVLFNDVVMFYVAVMANDVALLISTSSKDLYVVYELLTIKTKERTSVKFPLLFKDVPSDFRRAAIKKAAGIVKSWNSNKIRWDSKIEKALKSKSVKTQNRLKKKAGKPPTLPTKTNFPAQFYSGMFKSDTGETVLIKLWTGNAWVWLKVDYKCRELPQGYIKGSMSLMMCDQQAVLIWTIQKNTPSKGKLDDQIKASGKIRILSIDLNLDDPIVVGKVLEGYEDTGVVVELANLRLCGNNRLSHLRKRILGKIAKAKALTNTHTELGFLPPKNMCANLWKRIKQLEKEIIETISNSIVKFAQQYLVSVIVFENLKTLKPQKGKYSKRSNTKRSFWVAKKIQKRTTEKALNRFSIYTVKVNPAYTSITDAYHGGKCLRGSQVGALNLYLWTKNGLGKLVLTPENKIYDSGENAAKNIGLKYLVRKFEKPVTLKHPGLSTGCVAWLKKPVDKGTVVIPSWFACTATTK
ncbi:hypothetical protein NIES4071_53270 [Calothrix sp. NIES-4071]|nr:hypothetical protein NIES4071_36340 [Calothrix sp. NIES-4071]BAZ13488.1 hypothetical protein NIES4071_53270 [Calothrix sp. NIES-4071]BAZ57953.1 hypothetical protein NIES4105_36270 [Calothrix sp. NIES-4105]BAZ59635.1 hypothetical protein NIES4105_53220 [Calothrix sp. NIES-4105]